MGRESCPGKKKSSYQAVIADFIFSVGNTERHNSGTFC